MQLTEILSKKGPEIYKTTPKSTVFDAIKLMSEKDVGALLVMDGEKLAGIISERDYRNKVILKGRRSAETRVEEIMTTQVYVVQPTETVTGCLGIMTERKIRHLPVVEESGKVVGVVSIGDLVKAKISKQEVEISTLRKYISGEYPG